jgi:hypothetical protein
MLPKNGNMLPKNGNMLPKSCCRANPVAYLQGLAVTPGRKKVIDPDR